MTVTDATNPVDGPDDAAHKLRQLAALAREHELSTLVLREPANLTWLLGARVHVPQTLESACLDVVVEGLPDAPRMTVVTDAIEAPRLRETELADVEAEFAVVPWWEARDGRLPAGPGTGSDRSSGDGTVPLGPRLAELRRVLTPREQHRMTALCASAASAATAAAYALTPRTTEYQAAGLLARELMDRELDPVVLLVAGDGRIGPHRHPLPTGAEIGPRAMLVCCARRHGLIASVTRTVAFGKPDLAVYERLLQVEREFLDATRPGVAIGEAFSRGVAAYAANGFEETEWHRHHQGGFSGFQPREFLAHSSSRQTVREGCVVAWNPSGGGWKTEDTCLITADGPRPLVHDDAWPSVETGGRVRPGVLVR